MIDLSEVITVESWDGVSPIPLTELPTRPCPAPGCDQGVWWDGEKRWARTCRYCKGSGRKPVGRGDRVVVVDTTDCPGTETITCDNGVLFDDEFPEQVDGFECPNCGGSGRVSRRRTAAITGIMHRTNRADFDEEPEPCDEIVLSLQVEEN